MENYLNSEKPFKNSLGKAVRLLPDISRICSVFPKPSNEAGEMKLKPQCRMYSSRMRADSNACSPNVFNGLPSK